LRLINDVLDMAKIESGRMTLQVQGFDLHRMLDELAEMFRLRAAAKGLRLTVMRDPDVPRFVHADEGKLGQVLINLLGNAIKFTQAGAIGLRVRQVATGVPRRLVFDVRDTGPGIALGELAVIFEPFVQVDNVRAVPDGTGLGLPISRHFVRLMGGDLTASSAGVAGQGSLFVFDIPVGTADEADLTDPQQPVRGRAIGLAAGQPPYRLLVVEDRAESRTLLAKLLTQLGFAVRTAENGMQAIQVWQEWQPHLIWMDMRMPVMDGHEATRRIKATAQGQATVIIAVTASVFEEQRALVIAEGCDDFVRKPFREDEIVAQLVKHLGVRMVYASTASASRAVHDLHSGFELAGLPKRWISQVKLTATAADASELLKLADQIGDDQPVLAAALHTWVDAYDYPAILAAIAGSEEIYDEYAEPG